MGSAPNPPATGVGEVEVLRPGSAKQTAHLMLKRYGDDAEAKSVRRADELAADGEAAGVAVWRRIIDAVGQLTNVTPPGKVH